MESVVLINSNKRNYKICEHCGIEVPNNVYSRNHGDKCPYANVPEGFKRCKNCGLPKPIEDFYLIKNNTFDGRHHMCSECISKLYNEKNKE